MSTQDLAPCSSDLRICMNDDVAFDFTNQETHPPTASDEIVHPMENHPKEVQKDNDSEHETPTHRSRGSEEARGPEVKRLTRIRHKPDRFGHNIYD